MLTAEPRTEPDMSVIIEYDGPDLSRDEWLSAEERLHYEYNLLNQMLIEAYEFLRYAYDTTPLMSAGNFVWTPLVSGRDILGPHVPTWPANVTGYLYNYWL